MAPTSDSPCPPDIPSAQPLSPRGVALFCTLAVLNHLVLTGGRVAMALEALAQGASSFTVGVLVSLFALLPMLLSVHSGRWVDRIGVRRPMRVGTLMLIGGSLLPVVATHTHALFVASCAIGIGGMLYQISTQNLLGQHATPERRTINFSYFSLSMSVSGFSGPLIAGLAIDNLGPGDAFGLLAVSPMIALVALLHYRRLLPRTFGVPLPRTPHGVLDLLAEPMLRRVLLATALISGAWDINAFMVPVAGAAAGLSATTIGIILSSFALATFVIRLALPWLQTRVAAWTMIRAAMAVAAVVFVAYPLFTAVPVLIALAFVLGLALGSCQPSVLSLLHTHAPPGRAAEALGLRMGLINGGQFALPLSFGGLSAIAGLALPFWVVAVFLFAGCHFIRAPGVPGQPSEPPGAPPDR